MRIIVELDPREEEALMQSVKETYGASTPRIREWKPFMSEEEASEELGISVKTFQRHLRDKGLPVIKIGSMTRVKSSELLKILDENKVYL